MDNGVKAFEERVIKGDKIDRKAEAKNLGFDEFNYYNFLDEVDYDHDLHLAIQ
jgi:hypothetical protein